MQANIEHAEVIQYTALEQLCVPNQPTNLTSIVIMIMIFRVYMKTIIQGK